jgi:hypothetical protein
MSDTPQLDELKKLNDRLTNLLEDPQTGLFSWHDCLSTVLTEIAKFAPVPKETDYASMDCYYGNAWKECTPMRGKDDCTYYGKCRKCP